jgi:uncharacterized membrane protein YbhN (UPF0104 family)
MNLFNMVSARWLILARVGEERVAAFFSGLSALTDIGRFGKALAWMAVVWTLTLGEYHLLLLAFVPNAKPLWTAFGLGVTAMGVSVPSSPGYVGVYEAALVGGLTLFGIEASVAFAYAVTVHLMFLLMTSALGAYGLARDGLSLSRVYRQVKQGTEPRGGGREQRR